jgi:hypothetical protein
MGGFGIDIGANIGAALGEVQQELKAGRAVGQTQLRIGWRKYAPIVGSITGKGSQTVGASIVGPEAGRLWHVHRLSFGPVQPAGAFSTQGTIIIGKGTGVLQQAQGSGQLVANQSSQFIFVDQGTVMPSQFTWGRGQFVVVYPMNIIVLWASGTDGAGVVVDGDAYEYLAETAQPAPG